MRNSGDGTFVRKPVLGRGLGSLMNQTKSPPKPGDAGEKPGRLSPGLGAFLRGGSGGEQRETQPELPSAEAAERRSANPRDDGGEGNTDSKIGGPPDAGQLAGSKRLLRGSLVVADLLLVGLAARLAVEAHGHLGIAEVALCVVAVGMGAWLACLAVLRR
jgi:hypothetical protein